jgi:hypothetical protein
MDSNLHEEQGHEEHHVQHHVTHEEEAKAPSIKNKISEKTKAGALKFYDRLKKFTYLETVGTAAIFLLVISSLFNVDVTVTRKPLLYKLLGQKAPEIPKFSLDSSAADMASHHPGTAPAAPSQPQAAQTQAPVQVDQALLAEVIPTAGVELPATWGDLGKQMVASGVIDQQKFEALYAQRGGLSAADKKMLLESGNGRIKITPENSGTILNMLWALGLGNNNEILSEDMKDAKYGGDPAKFASTGGWPLATGQVMDHYSKHSFIKLTTAQQALVDKVSKGVFRVCCGNSTHFPDCNHGMAMLGLLELMASQGVSEQDMYKAALAVNSYWFPENYVTIASYFKKQGTNWNKVNPQVVLSAQYSSGQGYQQLLQQVSPQQLPKSQGGCGA